MLGDKLLLLVFLLFWIAHADIDQCRFTSENGFYAHVASDLSIGEVVFKGTVEPADADLRIANVRSDIFNNTDWSDRVVIDRLTDSGSYFVRVVSSLSLPVYPSKVRETRLFVTVICNGDAFPLYTIHVDPTNRFAPQFYNEPYIVAIPRGLPASTVFDTPVAAIDWDPADEYHLRFWLEDAHQGFELLSEPRKVSNQLISGSDEWDSRQLPTVVRLKITGQYNLPVTLRLIASDNEKNPRRSTTFVNILERVTATTTTQEPTTTYTTTTKDPTTNSVITTQDLTTNSVTTTQDPATNSVTTTQDPATNPVTTTTKDPATNPVTTTTKDPTTNSVTTTTKDPTTNPVTTTTKDPATNSVTTTTISPPTKKPENVKRPLDEILVKKKSGEKAFGGRTLQSTNAIQTEFVENGKDAEFTYPVRFAQCSMRTTLMENSPIGTKVAKLELLNRNNDTKIRLIDPDETFSIDESTDEITISDAKLIDRELFSTLELVAEITNADPSVQCSRIRIYVDLDDENDNRPVFEAEQYFFHLSPKFPAGKEIGRLVAQDIDQGSNGQITYHLLTPDVPFQIGTQGKRGVLMSSARLDPSITVYNLSVEARDHGQEVTRSARVPVEIYVLPASNDPTMDREIPESSSMMTNIDLFIERQNAIDTTTTTTKPTNDVVEQKSFAFQQPAYHYDVFGTEIHENDVIGRVDAQPNPQFFATDREIAGIVKINERGELLAGKLLNHHAGGALKFGISATNGIATARAEVTILRDANRDPMSAFPRFDQDVYRFSILENQQPEVIGIARAFHSALSASQSLRITYSLIGGAQIDELPFEIHSQSGEVSTTRALDAEQQSGYQFQVRACLTQTLCSTSIVIVDVEDVNDNSPMFVDRTVDVNVESDVPPGTKIVRLYANDADRGNNSRITFSIIPEDEIFSINPSTGQIVSRNALSKPLYQFLVDASDNGVPRRSDTTQITIHVHGTNPTSPFFDQDQYAVSVSSPIRAGQVIGEVHATDPDPGDEGQVEYRILPADNEDHRKFSINKKTGVISALTTLRTEDAPIELTIEASDNGKSVRRKTSRNVKIEIVESKTIKFMPLPSTVYISTEKAVGSVVLRVSAISANDPNIKFRVLQDSSQFVMDGDLLRVANHLVEGESMLSIRAETPTSHVDHRLKVIVMADRDKYPVFPQLTYDFDVSTDGHFPRVIHQFNAKLTNGTIRYTFFPPTPPDGFYIDEKSGELFVTSHFRSLHSETVFIVIRAINTLYTKFYSDVGIAVTPISTTKPTLKFQQNSYNFEIYENLPVSGIVGTPSMIGNVANLEFSISPDDSFLAIHPNGTIFLVESVDAEQMDVLVHDFTITVSDGKETARARVQIAIRDVNEFKPEFEEDEIEFDISSDISSGTKIGRVIATDKDISERDRLTYRIVGGSGRKLVFIREDGTIIAGDEPIESEIDSFDLIIEAVDKNGNHDQTHVTVYVDSENGSPSDPPVFLGQPLIWNVTEGTTETFEIRATGESIRFRIIGGDLDGNFDIVHMPNHTARLRIISELDHRTRSAYTLQIEGRDEKTQLATICEVVVNVHDSNDHAPTFTETDFSGTVPIDIPIGFPIVTITASDVDRDPIQFSLQGESCESQFGIDTLGRVSYRIPKTDRMSGQVICLVIASDGEHSSHANLRLKILESSTTESPEVNNPPVFENEQYTFRITNNPTNSSVGVVRAADPENQPLSFSIEPTEYRNLFHVDSTGHIKRLARADDLHQTAYSFLVVVEDRGKPVMTSFTNVKIIIEQTATTPIPMIASQQDNEASLEPSEIPNTSTTQVAIQFSQPTYSWKIERNMPIGSIVGQIEINQKDATIEFSFISADYLAVDSAGRVTIAKQIHNTINDVIIATRKGNILAESRIFVSMSNPTTTVPTAITMIPITLRTALPTTSQTSSNHLNTLPDAGGQSSVTSSARIIPMEIVTPPTTPSSKFSFSHKNYFAFSTEGEYKSGIELEVKPSALSTVNSGGRVVYSIEDTTTKMPFFVTEQGKLIMFEADRERHSSYSFTVVAKTVASGVEKIARARMNVTILDVNDNYPLFDKHPEVIGIGKKMHVGSPIYQLHATDADADAAISYEITPKHFFSIDPRDGLIRVLRDLRQAPDDVELVVVASDSGKPPLRTEAKILMRLFDEEAINSGPHLPKGIPELVIGTEMVPGTIVKHIVAGPTVIENDKILYRLVDSIDGLFEMKDGGVILLARRPLDIESNRYHQLNITAENSKGSDWTVINVYVEGRLNHTTPSTSNNCRFTEKIYKTRVEENSPPRTPVIKVRANCDRKIRYAFHHTSDEFDIDPQSGQIYLKKVLDREIKSFYFLYVNVIEQTRLKRQSRNSIQEASSNLSPWQTLVVVSVGDQNDNPPVFLNLLEDSTLSAVIDRNANIMTPIIQLQARDLDIAPEVLKFGMDGENSQLFYINQTNGLIQLAKSLDSIEEEEISLEVTVTDGLHLVKVPLNIYPLSVDTNVVQLTKDTANIDIDPSDVERKLSNVLDSDTRILVAQPFVDEEGITDPKRSHIFVYALEGSHRSPMNREDLKSRLMEHSNELLPMRISSISLLSTNSAALSSQTLITAVLIVFLLALLFFICTLIICCIKRSSKSAHSAIIQGSYMVDSTGSGPRPYDVENISRTTAQKVLASRPLPNPQENRRELAVSPAFLPDSEVVVERDDTTKEFSNSIRERPSLLQSSIGRHKIYSEGLLAKTDDIKP